MKCLFALVALLFCLPCLCRTAEAGYIDYNFSGSLSLFAGVDGLALNGAKLDIDAHFSTTDIYGEQFGLPVVVADIATLTITGSVGEVNDGTYDLGPALFAPSFAGLFSASPDGGYVVVNLRVGGPIELQDATNPTATGANAQIGDTIHVSDFAPATAADTGIYLPHADYVYSNIGITASVQGAVPEPSSLVLCGIAGVVGLGVARVRRRTV